MPSSLAAFCRARGISPYHPYDTWTDEDHAEFYQWKLSNLKEKWKALREDGTTRLMSLEQLLRWTRDSLDALKRPVPSRPYKSCPCHRRPRQLAEDRTPMVHGLAYIESFRRGAVVESTKLLKTKDVNAFTSPKIGIPSRGPTP